MAEPLPSTVPSAVRGRWWLVARFCSWGHTALLTSACVDNTTWAYLIHPQAPAPKVTHCRGDVQPFAPSPANH